MNWLRVYLSPFKPPIPKLYIGKIAIGTPYFYPRNMKLNKEKRVYEFSPKKIGFDFVPMRWKTKWEDTDYRFETSPIWSFVFFKWQIAITFIAPYQHHFWTCWLYYTRNTDKTKSTKERLIEAQGGFPCIWVRHTKDSREKINYWNLILKKIKCTNLN